LIELLKLQNIYSTKKIKEFLAKTYCNGKKKKPKFEFKWIEMFHLFQPSSCHLFFRKMKNVSEMKGEVKEKKKNKKCRREGIKIPKINKNKRKNKENESLTQDFHINIS